MYRKVFRPAPQRPDDKVSELIRLTIGGWKSDAVHWYLRARKARGVGALHLMGM
jgi:hypothetical protein